MYILAVSHKSLLVIKDTTLKAVQGRSRKEKKSISAEETFAVLRVVLGGTGGKRRLPSTQHSCKTICSDQKLVVSISFQFRELTLVVDKIRVAIISIKHHFSGNMTRCLSVLMRRKQTSTVLYTTNFTRNVCSIIPHDTELTNSLIKLRCAATVPVINKPMCHQPYCISDR